MVQGFSQTADNFSSYKLYTGKYSFGENPGWYGFNWSTQQILSLCAGKQDANIQGLGAKSFRMKLSDDFLTMYGLTSILGDYQYIRQIGCGEVTAFVGDPSPAHTLDSSFYYYIDGTTGDTVRPRSRVWKGMFEPVFNDDGTVNQANTFAAYLEPVIKTYGEYVSFWEVINEPDFTYGDGGWLADADPTNKGTWFYKEPSPEDMYNLHAPFKYYLRALEIAWQVIKKYDLNDNYVCTGGIGNRSFLHAILREGGGKWFDVISFHTYPEFSTLVSYWNNAIGAKSYERHSDRLVDGHMLIRHWMDSIARVFGYDGINKPSKQFICTETGTSAYPGNDGVSGSIVQLNYCIKAHVEMMRDGNVKQAYWYTSSDACQDCADHWQRFGQYEYIGDDMPWNATRTRQGVGQKTTSDILYGAVYDANKTASLNLPSTARGAAFKRNGQNILVLWARTFQDQNENASTTVNLSTTYIRKEWDYCVTKAVTSASGSTTLSSTPSFFEQATALPIEDHIPRPQQDTRKRYDVEVYNHVYQFLGKRRSVYVQDVKKELKPGIYILKYDQFTEVINKR